MSSTQARLSLGLGAAVSHNIPSLMKPSKLSLLLIADARRRWDAEIPAILVANRGQIWTLTTARRQPHRISSLLRYDRTRPNSPSSATRMKAPAARSGKLHTKATG